MNGKKTFTGNGQVLKSKKFSLNSKKGISKCHVLSTFIYGCESWSISQAIQERLEAAEIWLVKRKHNIS